MKINKPVVLRKSLIEGRNYGMGFSILKKEKDSFTPLIDFTACKDFLNEISYGEAYKKNVNKVHGFSHTYSNYFEFDNKYMYLCVNAINNKQESYSDFDKFEYILISNYLKLKKVLNYFDRKLKLIPSKVTKIEIEGKPCILIKADKFWMKETVLLSFYTLIVRRYFNYELRVSKKSLINHKPFINKDAYIVNGEQLTFILDNLNLLDKYKTEQLPESRTSHQVHNNGIAHYIKEWKK